jgi:RNA polymerase sigma-70 factor (ECF subfamily)
MNQEASENLDAKLRELVMLTRIGDQDAYKRLLVQLAPIIRRVAYKRLSAWDQQHQAEDITQETLLAIHLKLHTYNAELPFLAWVNAVAKHKLIDHLRRTKTTNISIDDENLPELIDPANPEAAAIATDLNKLLARLKPPIGDIIYALKVEGATVREVAKTHKLSEGYVKVLVHRGLQKLSQLTQAEAG